ncbi:virulence factor family protein [Robbsia andropogonis]|uniref:virulence factor family protein n=2 Tax=Robbsia andropogonis TaxID=28092 RepID=UPI002A6A3B3F|nr:AcvB/VirJ family lysyl-phosphatidylglycerol hydrolase [Robbsia andropogonis]
MSGAEGWRAAPQQAEEYAVPVARNGRVGLTAEWAANCVIHAQDGMSRHAVHRTRHPMRVVRATWLSALRGALLGWIVFAGPAAMAAGGHGGGGHGGGPVGMRAAKTTTPPNSASAPVVPQPTATGEKTISGGLFGDVTYYAPAGSLRGFVVLYSGKSGWQASDRDAAQALAKNGAMVVGVDTQRYAARLSHEKEDASGCHYLVGDAEAVSHQLQREAHSSRYFLPILAGSGQGALVAERALGRAPSNTLAGAIVVDPDGTLDARFAPCPNDQMKEGNGPSGFLSAASTSGESVMPAISTGGRPLVTKYFPKGTSDADVMSTLVIPHLAQTGTPSNDDVSDLPLVAMPSSQPSDLLAIVISGDGGWRDLDKSVAEAMQKRGVNVVGVDALRYFWSEHTPEQTAHDIARIIEVYGRRWHTQHVALIGYSFGADVMPFMYNRLPLEDKVQVSLIALMGFSPRADFQIRVTGWLGMQASSKALPTLPEAAKIPTPLLQCFYGVEEDDTACPELAKRGVNVVKMEGGHHFGGSYDDLALTILNRWKAQFSTK